MKLFLPKYPLLLRILYPERISKVKIKDAIYLTFDDGPIPEITPWVLDLLREYHAKATFFCIGDNVKKHSEIFRRIAKDGHGIGNHTYNHLNGWNTDSATYFNNILQAETVMAEVSEMEIISSENSEPSTPNYKLFRPPYGKIKNSQARKLSKKGYKVVLWDVISGDYDKDFSAEKCLSHVIDNAEPGSTIVFHDSKKAFRNLKETLPKVLEYYSEKGMEFRSLKDIL